MSFHFMQAVSFWDCVNSMKQDDKYKSALMDTLGELQKNPLRSSKLHTHKIGKARNGKDLFATDVGGRAVDRRVVWQLINRTVVCLLYGTHKIYDRAKRMRIAMDPVQGIVQVYEVDPRSQRERPHRTDGIMSPSLPPAGKLFMAWTDKELAGFGLPPAVCAHLRRIDDEEQFWEMERHLGDHFETAFKLLAHDEPHRPQPEPQPEDIIAEDSSTDEAALKDVLEPVVTEDDLVLEAQLKDDHMGRWFTRTEPEFLADVIGRPIEDWMIFLHPAQKAAVRRDYRGPARISGPAGTGKTVIGLHRTEWLAERNRRLETMRSQQLITERQPWKPVLFSTYIRTLPPVLRSLYRRLPGTREKEVEFVNIDKLARHVCHEAGEHWNTPTQAINVAFTAAYRQVVVPGTPLAESGRSFSENYLRDEITYVIKGRALETLEEYLAIERTGRSAPMRHRQRAQVWQLMEAWNVEMQRTNVCDFADVILRALHHARQLDEPRYSAVVVDEAQDLTLAGLQFLRALVNAPDYDSDRNNGLMVIGDGAQRIYPGGFKLRQAGVEVRGRSTRLAQNYRNTTQILSTALEVAGDIEIVDLGEHFRRGDVEVASLRHGPRPRLIHAHGLDAQLDMIVGFIGDLTVADESYGLGDMAILAPNNGQVDAATKRLNRQGFACQPLEKYDGRPSDRVKVGTYHRAKGLEFKVVFLLQVSRGMFPWRRGRKQTEAEYTEKRELQISQLFVAMTRARDLLVVFYDHAPSEVLASASDRFDARDSQIAFQPRSPATIPSKR